MPCCICAVATDPNDYLDRPRQVGFPSDEIVLIMRASGGSTSVGAAAGMISNTLKRAISRSCASLGIPMHAAVGSEEAVGCGGLVLVVSTDNAVDVETLGTILAESGGQHISGA